MIHPTALLLLLALLVGCSAGSVPAATDGSMASRESQLLFPDGPGSSLLDGGSSLLDGASQHSLPGDAALPDLLPPLQVGCDASPKVGPAPLKVGFTAAVSGGGGANSFSWDFGDKEGATTPQPGHTYQDVGLFLCVVTVTSGAQSQSCSTQLTVVVDQVVNVPGEGGVVELSFSSRQGQTLRITLTATNSALVPYGYLETPAKGSYMPPIATAKGAMNSSQLTLSHSGDYVLSIFDAANIGGSVRVQVEPI